MSQSLILDKIAIFMRHINPVNKSPREQGYCHGFAVCHAAMAVIGKNDWWEEVLVAIATWDEDLTKLNQIVKLPGKEQYTLQTIFERAINYIFAHQVSSRFIDFAPSGLKQRTLLDSAAGYFELYDDQNKQYKIQGRNSIAGYFSDEKLAVLIQKENTHNNICMLYSQDHTLRLGFHDSIWILYDANNSHASRQTMSEKFNTKKALINEIIAILGRSLAIEICTFEKNKKICFPDISEMIDEKNVSLLQDFGFKMIVHNASHHLPFIMSLADKALNVAESIVLALNKKDMKGCAGLSMLAGAAPVFIPMALSVAAKTKQGIKSIALTLEQQDMHGNTGLEKIILLSPAHLPFIFSLAEQQAIVAESVMRALKTKCHKGRVCFRSIVSSQPNYLLSVLSLVRKNPQIAEDFILALTTPDYFDGRIVLSLVALFTPQYVSSLLETIAVFAPTSLPVVFCVADKESIVADSIALAIKKSFQTLVIFASAYLHLLFLLTDKAPQLAENIVFALKTQNKNDNNGGRTGLQTIAISAPKCLSAALSLADRTLLGTENLADALIIQSNDGCTGLQTIAQYAPLDLQNALIIAGSAPGGIKKIMQALALENNKHETGRHTIKKAMPNFNIFILGLVSKNIKKLKTHDLKYMQDELSLASVQPYSIYRGMCKTKPLPFFGRYQYKETTLSRGVAAQIDRELKQRVLLTS